VDAQVKTAAIATAADPLWYKDAIIYQLHVKSFFDSNDDGIGDFPGLISKLDYICDLARHPIRPSHPKPPVLMMRPIGRRGPTSEFKLPLRD